MKQPFTFNGVASYADASFGHLAVFSLPIALLISTLMLHFMEIAVLPPLVGAIAKLPVGASLRSGKLIWPSEAEPLLSESPFLSLAVNPDASRAVGQHADFQIQLQQDQVQLRAIMGEYSWAYSKNWIVGLTRAEVEPWWGARQHLMKGCVFLGTFLFLQLSWITLATGATFFVWLLALILNRPVTLAGSWKLSYAALFTGAILMGGAVWCYANLRLSLTGLGVMLPLHLLVWFLVLCGGIWALPKVGKNKSQHKNPFKK